jgi:hypothetical protein
MNAGTMRPSRIASDRISRHAIRTDAINAAGTGTGVTAMAVIATRAIKPRATNRRRRNSGNSVRLRKSRKPDPRDPRRNRIPRTSPEIRRCAVRAAAARGQPKALAPHSISGRIGIAAAGPRSKPTPNQ